MSKVFYDHIIELEEVEKKLKKIAKTPQEREELYNLVDEILHHKVMGCILDKLPHEHHPEFLEQVSSRPHDEGIFRFLKDRVAEDIEDFIKKEVHLLTVELLTLLEAETRPRKP